MMVIIWLTMVEITLSKAMFQTTNQVGMDPMRIPCGYLEPMSCDVM